MSRKSKYTMQQKIQAVLDYKSGKYTISQICTSLGIHESGKTLYQWIAMYEKDGKNAFVKKEHVKIYSKEVKESAIKEYMNGLGSYQKIALKYGISSSSTLQLWINKKNNEKKETDILRVENKLLRRKLAVSEKENLLWRKVKKIEEKNSKLRGGDSKYKTIKELHEEYSWSIHWMCKVLQISRAGYYAWLERNTRQQ